MLLLLSEEEGMSVEEESLESLVKDVSEVDAVDSRTTTRLS